MNMLFIMVLIFFFHNYVDLFSNSQAINSVELVGEAVLYLQNKFYEHFSAVSSVLIQLHIHTPFC